ncbi:hypothetical protein [Actinomycetospora sp.]
MYIVVTWIGDLRFLCVHHVTLGYQEVTGRLVGERRGNFMIILGVILIIIGAVTGISILYTIGAILAIVGLVLTILGAVGRGIGGRKTYF